MERASDEDGAESREDAEASEEGPAEASEERRTERFQEGPADSSKEGTPVVVGIGASAGGLNALREFFSAIPE